MNLPKVIRMAAGLAAANLLVAGAEAKLDFVKDVKPVLEQNCVGCHNAQHADENGNYSMETKADAFKAHGAKQRVSSGHPEDSQVFTLTQRPVSDDKVMPPKERPRLTAEEMNTIKTWIAEGADWPDGVKLKTQINFVSGIKPLLEKGGPFSTTELRDLKTWISEGAYWPAGVKLEGATAMPKATAGEKIDFTHDVLPILSNGGPLAASDVATLQRWVEQGAQWSGGGKKNEELKRVEAIRRKIVQISTEKTSAEMKAYTNTIPATSVTYAMVPIPGGEFLMGSPENEPKSSSDEHPQHKVKIEPFWMEQTEATWNEYELWMYPNESKPHSPNGTTNYTDGDVADAVSAPTKPYVEMSFGMGKDKFPAISMTQHAANKYCEWLSAKTGHFYRLPTEGEWEYACRAGTTTAYSFGDDASKLGDYAWFGDNSDLKYQKVGKKKPNPWGLYDMHGNVAEWCLDQYDADYYKQFADKVTTEPWNVAKAPYPHSVRGGAWDSDADRCRSASRTNSTPAWKQQDPQLPKSIWYLTDAQFVGFRIIRPLTVPPAEEMYKYWNSGVEKE
jgi:formylglycine-generating enzyme required for sulfatase activity